MDIKDFEQQEKFVIDDDKKADWAVKKIAEEKAERDRLVELAKAEIEELKAKIEWIETAYNDRTGFLKSQLAEYFRAVEHKETKTKETYKLLNGTLEMKKARQEIRHDDGALLEYFRNNGMAQYIKTTEKPMWAEFKKSLEIAGDIVVNTDTGEQVECLTVEEIPEEFNVAV